MSIRSSCKTAISLFKMRDMIVPFYMSEFLFTETPHMKSLSLSLKNIERNRLQNKREIIS